MTATVVDASSSRRARSPTSPAPRARRLLAALDDRVADPPRALLVARARRGGRRRAARADARRAARPGRGARRVPGTDGRGVERPRGRRRRRAGARGRRPVVGPDATMAFPEVGVGELPCWGGTQRLHARRWRWRSRCACWWSATPSMRPTLERSGLAVLRRRPGRATPRRSPAQLARGCARRAGRGTRRGAARARPHARRRAAARVRSQPADLDHRPTAPRASPRSSRSGRRASPANDTRRLRRRAPGVAVARRALVEPGRRSGGRSRRGAARRRPPRACGAAACRGPNGPRCSSHRRRLGAPGAADRVGDVHRHGDLARRAGPAAGRRCPDLRADRRRGRRRGRAWLLPAVAVRARAGGPPIPRPRRRPRRRLAAPPSSCSAPRGRRRSSGCVLADLGARVVRIEHPRPARSLPAPRPPRARARNGSRSTSGRAATATQLRRAPRRRRPARRRPPAPRARQRRPRRRRPPTDAARASSVLRVAAFVDDDRPGYGLAAEAAAAGRPATTRPRLGRARRSPIRSPGCSARSPRSSCSRARRRAPAPASRSRARSVTCSRGSASGALTSGSTSTRRDGVVEIVFDHPPINIYDVATRDALCEVLTAVDRRSRRAASSCSGRRRPLLRRCRPHASSAPRRRCSRCATPAGGATCGASCARSRCR